MKTQKLGIIGGTFDPVHNGHLLVAEWLQKSLYLDKVYFIPNHIHPFQKRNDITPDNIRLQMLRIALADYPNFEIDTIELDKQGISYSVDTIRFYKKRYPPAELFLLIGEDNYSEFYKWKDPEEIKDSVQVVVYRRKSADRSEQQPDRGILFVDSPEIDISSTQIRNRIKEGQSCSKFLPQSVDDFILENGLYR